LEAATFPHDIEQSLNCLNGWLATSLDRFCSRWTWKPEFGLPHSCKGVVLFLDLIGSTKYTHYQDLSNVVRRFMEVVNQFGGFYDKFTGDGLMAVFLEQSRSQPHQVELAEQALKCARGLRYLMQQEFASLYKTSAQFNGCQIGLSAGEFMFGDHGLPDRPEVTATGPTVVCAARLANDRDLRNDPESAILASNEFYLYGKRTEASDRMVREEYRPTGLDEATKVWKMQ
jgi:class 3 adenylate cyclase